MTQFTDSNVTTWNNSRTGEAMFKIYCDREDLVYDPLPWQVAGLQQTASGYGRPTSLALNARAIPRLECVSSWLEEQSASNLWEPWQ